MADQQATTDMPPLPMLVGRVDEASLDEIIAWARHPHVCMGNIAGQVIERLIRDVQSAARTDDHMARQMFSDGVDVARAYGDNAFHLWGSQLERQYQVALARWKAGGTSVSSSTLQALPAPPTSTE